MKIITKISLQELQRMSENFFGNLVKAVVDIEKKLIAVDAQLHSDLETHLLENGSEQKNLWGINFYPEEFGSENFIEFDSMINLRPSQGNLSRGVEDEKIRKKILEISMEQIENL